MNKKKIFIDFVNLSSVYKYSLLAVLAIIEIACCIEFFGLVASTVIGVINAFLLAFCLCCVVNNELVVDLANDFNDDLKRLSRKSERKTFDSIVDSFVFEFASIRDKDTIKDITKRMIEYSKLPGTYNNCIFGDVLYKVRACDPELAKEIVQFLVKRQ